ncbi:MAG: molybdopterin-guanine dinucleotide biosynthesis protein B [Chloroflexi bacterium]|nr:molybdopterin-guanine dinucleotide biosynthesis protein B [Chloroflexota bacterium]
MLLSLDQEILMPPIVCIVGRSNSGKTTFLERLIPVLKRRGLRLAVIKHHSHGDFDIDIPGKDTWRFAAAGSDQVWLISPNRLAQFVRLEQEVSLEQVAAGITGVDLILTEGFKRSPQPKIEVTRQALTTELLCQPDELLAVVADYAVPVAVPLFGFEDAAGVADLLVRTYHLLNHQH